jgi:hypothetical protein
MRAIKFKTGHVIFKLPYNQIYHLKTTITSSCAGSVFLKMSVDELAKPSKKEKCEKEASFVDSEKPTDLPPVVPCPD